MPVVSGLEVIRRLRTGPPEQAAMPLIALTAYVMHEHRAAIDGAGADGVIAKPILSIKQMAEDILAMMERRRAAARSAGRKTAPKETARREAGPAPVAGQGDDLPPPTRSATAAQPAPVGAPDRARARIDREVFDALAATLGRAEMPRLLARLEEDLDALRRDAAQGCATGDREILRRASHSLISIAGTIGAMRLQHSARCLNSAAHSGEVSDLRAIGTGLLSEIDAVSGFVRDCLCDRG